MKSFVVAQRPWLGWAACIVLVALNIAAQVVIQRDNLNDDVMTYSELDDGLEYVARAELLHKKGDFKTAFGNAYRTPGYPAYLAGLMFVSDQPLLLARYSQVILSASAILFAYLILLHLFGSPWAGITGALAVASWYPLYHFSTTLFAESISVFVLALLLYALARIRGDASVGQLTLLALLTAVLVSFKPNHILLALPVLIYLWHSAPRASARLALYPALLFILILPWSIFISLNNKKPILLSATSGVNLYMGAGKSIFPQEKETLFYKFGTAMGFPLADSGLFYAQTQRVGSLLRIEFSTKSPDLIHQHLAEDPAALHGIAVQKGDSLKTEALARWKSRPFATAFYALGKTLHGFGFSLRGARDALTAAMFLLSLASALFLWKRPSLRKWSAFYWGCLFITVFQFVLYLPAHRLRLILFDFPAMLVIAIAAVVICAPTFKTKAE